MKKVSTILYLFIVLSVYAQDDPPPPPQNKWIPNGVVGLNFSQLALDNWTQGGEEALAFVVYSNLGLDYFANPWSFTNKLKVSFGRTKLGSNDFRTTDNEIFLENLLVYDANWFANPYFSNTLRTVLAKGYDYTDDNRVQIAEFFDPGYLHQSLGLAYKASESFMTRFGLAIEETFTNKFRAFSDDEDTDNKVENFRLEEGIESVSNLNLQLDDDLLYTSELRLFGSFQKFDEWDVRWDNIVTAQVTKLINVNLNILLIYDTDQIAKTQLKEALQIGITYTLF